MNDSLQTPIINCFRHMPSCWFLLWLLVFNFRYSNSACGYLSDKYGNQIRLSIELETILGIRFSKIVSIFIYLWRCITIAHIYCQLASIANRFRSGYSGVVSYWHRALRPRGARHRDINVHSSTVQWDEASDTDRHKHSNLGTGAGQGRIIMKEAFRLDMKMASYW